MTGGSLYSAAGGSYCPGMIRSVISVRARLAAWGLSLAVGGAALAQQAGPPTPKGADDPPAILYNGVLILLLLATLGVSLLPSKRGHQD